MTPEEATESVSVSSPHYDQLELWYEQHRREWVEGKEQQEAAMARLEAAKADPSAKRPDVYCVDEDLVAHILKDNPRATRKAVIDELREWGT